MEISKFRFPSPSPSHTPHKWPIKSLATKKKRKNINPQVAEHSDYIYIYICIFANSEEEMRSER